MLPAIRCAQLLASTLLQLGARAHTHTPTMHMHLQEHIDYDLVESTNPDWGRAVVRINVYRAHRQVGGWGRDIHLSALAPTQRASVLCCRLIQKISQLQTHSNAPHTLPTHSLPHNAQTVQYVQPQHAPRITSACELLVIDEAAAIPLPLVRAMLGPYLVSVLSMCYWSVIRVIVSICVP
jgi:N-acetyltransferase 10